MAPRVDDRSVIERCEMLQKEAYGRFGLTKAPKSEHEYRDIVDWVADQLEKTTILGMLDEEVERSLRADGFFVAANAVCDILGRHDDDRR